MPLDNYQQLEVLEVDQDKEIEESNILLKITKVAFALFAISLIIIMLTMLSGCDMERFLYPANIA